MTLGGIVAGFGALWAFAASRPAGVDDTLWRRLVARGVYQEQKANPALTKTAARLIAMEKLAADLNAYGEESISKKPAGMDRRAYNVLVRRAAREALRENPLLSASEAWQAGVERLAKDPAAYATAMQPHEPRPEGVTPEEWARLIQRGQWRARRARYDIPYESGRREAKEVLRDEPEGFGPTEPVPQPATYYTGRPAMQRRMKPWSEMSETTRRQYRINLKAMYGTAEPTLEQIRTQEPNIAGRAHETVVNYRSALSAWLRHLGVGPEERFLIMQRVESDFARKVRGTDGLGAALSEALAGLARGAR